MSTGTLPTSVTWTLHDMVENGTLAPSDALRVLADLQLERRRRLRSGVEHAEDVAA